MRYVDLILSTLPAFVLFGLLGWFPVSTSLAALISGISLIVGLFAGWYAVRVLKRSLHDNERHWSMRRFPGGIWFVVGAGLFIGFLLAPLLDMGETGRDISCCVSLAFGVSMTTLWAVVALETYRIERQAGKTVLLGPGGFRFQERGS